MPSTTFTFKERDMMGGFEGRGWGMGGFGGLGMLLLVVVVAAIVALAVQRRSP